MRSVYRTIGCECVGTLSFYLPLVLYWFYTSMPYLDTFSIPIHYMRFINMTISQIDRNRLEIIDESVKEIIANLETERDEDRFGGVADLIQSAVSHLIEDLT